MTLVLGFDTSAAHCAAAVVSDGRILAQGLDPMDRGQAERLMPLLADVLRQAGADYGDLAALGVGIGPGNFTGIRIAVSAARGLALGLAVPAIGVSGFDALALDLPPDTVISLDARRGAVWLAGPGIAPQMVTQDALPVAAMGRAVAGHHAADLAALTGGCVREPCYPMAVAIARIAAARLGTAQPRPAPLYLRSADATPPTDLPPVILP